ncbi:Glyoxalase/bleomycin resistance protein/dioxygenase [Pirellula staleyi DSM 6068]|uniref:Glyoxalase/bleomycin resistance protein/dioxygenase n=1 Tax=Pirellula staleyi (strain ATCC 27377 / DSM 6068 / ICPB 4128) TaxID=530564 RepID=D2R4L8_PIRSD|nr:Glyoxalase/bleomycin resistance protein/dioxygenase [Pirellula staleyi DSM 6068]
MTTLPRAGDNCWMKTLQLNHVAIHVADVERSCQFYRDILQLESLPRPPFTFPGAWFRIGGDQELHLIGERKSEVLSHNRGNHYAMLVDDIDAWERHLTEVGAQFFPRRIRPDGAYQIFLCDPDGYYIELCTPPGAHQG